MSDRAPGWISAEGWQYEPNDEASWWFTYFASLIDESGIVPIIEKAINDLRLPGPKCTVPVRLFLIMLMMQARHGGDLFIESARGAIRTLSLCIIEDETNGIIHYRPGADGEPDLTQPYLPDVHCWYRLAKRIERVLNVDEYVIERDPVSGRYIRIPRPAEEVAATRTLMRLLADTMMYCSIEPDQTVRRVYPHMDKVLEDEGLTKRQRRTKARKIMRAEQKRRRRLGLKVETSPQYVRTLRHDIVGIDGTADVPRVTQDYLTRQEVLALPHPFSGIRNHGDEDTPRCYELITAMGQTHGGANVIVGFDLEPGDTKAAVPAMHLVDRLRDRYDLEGVCGDEEFTQSRAFMAWVDATEFGIVYNPPAAHLKPRKIPKTPLVYWAGRFYPETIPTSLLPTEKRPSEFNTDADMLDAALEAWRRTETERMKHTPYEHVKEGRYGRKTVRLRMTNDDGHCVMCVGWRTPIHVDEHIPNPQTGDLHPWCDSGQQTIKVRNPNRDADGNQITGTTRFGLRQMFEYAADEWQEIHSLFRNGTEQQYESLKQKHGFSTAGSAFRCHGRTARYLAYICWLVNLNLRAQGIAAPSSVSDDQMDAWLAHGHRRCVGTHGGNCRCFDADHVCEHDVLPPLTSHDTYRHMLAEMQGLDPPEAA